MPSANVVGKSSTPDTVVHAILPAAPAAPLPTVEERGIPSSARESGRSDTFPGVPRAERINPTPRRESPQGPRGFREPTAELPVTTQKIDRIATAMEREPANRSQVGRPPLRLPVWRARTEEQLNRELLAVPEVKLDPSMKNELVKTAPLLPGGKHQLDHLISTAPVTSGVLGIPLRFTADCQSSAEHAHTLAGDGRHLKTAIARDERTTATTMTDRVLENHHWKTPEAVPALMQVLTAGEVHGRRQLVDHLADIPGAAATQGLVNRAVFDLNLEVRRKAAETLRYRPKDEYLAALLSAFRHPWAPAADHAAQTIVALNLQEAVAGLRELANEADPTAPPPTPEKPGFSTVRELVRINHHKNCVLCHQMSVDASDPARGSITPSTRYYDNPRGPFVRADVVYLRQDFSVTHPVTDVAPWPDKQRFDYVVRTRPLRPFERTPATHPIDSPQRGAVLFALRGLAERAEVDVARRND
jgi:hypothetical protein